MKKLYTNPNRIPLYLLKSALENKGIVCFMKNENPPLAGEIPPILAWPELWVMDDAQYEAAKKILSSELANFDAPKDAWVCPQCGERLDGQFDQCWKCGAARE